MDSETQNNGGRHRLQWGGLMAGPVAAVFIYMLLPEMYRDGQGETIAFSHAGRATAALAVWMAVWWMTEAIEIYATTLLPLAILPLTGATPVRQAAAPYAHELIFLFMGGFIIALAMQRWGLHRRFAFMALRLAGDNPHRIVGCFMGVTALLSMWVSNTATTIMMLPIALSVINLLADEVPSTESQDTSRSHFALCLLLGIAYAASIGGVGTIIGTPPNVFLASYIQTNLDQEISFVRWLGVGLPLVIIFLPLTWLLITRVLYPIRLDRIEGSDALTRDAYRQLGIMSRGEWAVLIIFFCTAIAWISRPYLSSIQMGGLQPFAGLSDSVIAMTAALALFIIPVDIKRRVFVVDWKTAAGIPWGLLLLFGGGLSLAAAIRVNGVGEFIGNQVGILAGFPPILLVLFVTTMVIFLTELTSNIATTATLIPILASLAPALDFHPFLLIIPATMAASCAFMLPVATPPNAIVFGSGHVTIQQMMRAGLWLNIAGIVIITGLTYAVFFAGVGYLKLVSW